MSSGTLRLFHSFESSSSWRVRIVLALKKIDYESMLIGLDQREHQQDTYRQINPIGQVPTLRIDGQNLSQSVAIIEYLNGMYPQPPLLPGDPISCARVREIVEIINSGIQPLNNGGLNRSFREQYGVTDPQIRAWKKFWIAHRLTGLEAKLRVSAGTYCFANSVTLADVFLFPQIDRAKAYDVHVGQFSTISGICERLSEIPEFVETGRKAV